ncbi:MAG TPA: hypothetical protein VFR18_03355 [Terriglobia bacterium]|nr:hypothetical protein [Terriglobia bacterium]
MNRRSRIHQIGLTAGLILLPVLAVAGFQAPYDFEHGPIAYTTSSPTDAIARLQSRIDSGQTKLPFDAKQGYLPGLLKELNIPRTSQSLVFSKTSLQLFLISPETPRAIYFNDDLYIGAVQSAPILEIAAMDPKLGAVFYTLPQKQEDKPQFQREFLACLLCHDTGVTNDVPGLMALSVLTDRSGNAITAAGTAPMSDRTPFRERFGGWYVTGTHGSQRTWGNLAVPVTKETIGDAKAYVRRLNLEPGANVASLESRFDTKRYLTPHSDLVAQLVLTHQTRIHNLLTRTRFDVASAGGDSQKIRTAVEPLVRGMLFVWEAGFEEPVSGSTSFATDFAKLGPHDRKGRTLRDLDLNKRLQRYPLSYLVYSEPFDALQPAAKERFFQRVREILTGQDTSKDFSHLSDADRQAILEILTDTKPEFAAFAKALRGE